MRIIRVGLDIAKHVFQVHGVDEADQPALRARLRRGAVVEFFGKLAATRVGLEACGAAHYWARALKGLGHEVVLLPPQYVKPYLKRGKSDAKDAEAICEAMSRPGMRFVGVKSAEEQAGLMLLKARELLVGQRTALSNAIRGHAAEFGVIGAKGPVSLARLVDRAMGEKMGGEKMGGEKMGGEEAGLPQQARDGLALLFRQYQRLDAEVGALDRAVLAEHENNPVSRCLASQPGVGPLTAVSFALKVADPRGFRSARHFAAWLGLTPKEHSTGGRQRLGGISREGDERLRQLLVLGATARIKAAKPGRSPQWLLALLARRPKKVAAVALANKMARTLWAMMISGELYREPGPRGLARPGHAEASAQAS